MSETSPIGSGRLTIDFVIPRIYVALPAGGSVDVVLNDDESPVETPLCADLIVWYAFDLDTHYQIVANRDLPLLGLTQSELHERALVNLYALNLDVQLHQGPNVAMLTAGGNYEATLVLLPTVWESLANNFPGGLVAAVPARDIIFFTGDGAPENLAELRRLTSKAIETAEKPLSRNFLQRTAAGWQPYHGFAD